MKHILLFITILTGSFSFAYAQEEEPSPEKKQQKIQALYVAYITQELNLNATEAEKFWPLHKQFDSELKAVDLINPIWEAQVLSHLKLTDNRLGYLINFNVVNIGNGIKRLIR